MASFPFLLVFAAAVLGPDDFTITIPVSPETPEGQRLLAIRAREVCGSRYSVADRYRFEGEERISPQGDRTSSFRVRQELTCSDTPPSPPTGEQAPADWQASEQDVRDVVAVSERYFAAVDGGDAEIAHAMWSEDQQAETPVAERRREIEEFRRQAGPRGAHPRMRLTWYVNPDGAPRPGVYVAVDYERFYANLALNCGYLIWYREGDARYRLTRQDNGIVAQSATPLPAEQLVQVRQQLRCPS
ncbi:MAG TPA: DUF4019 domain-containing protein [Allosphingosinicella sp.]|nr:DUF4019 domain-containing protein [Allosphingosinicella sp.]